jgi:hypothetical protein
VVVKTRNSNTLIDDLEETFASLREYRWKLNPNKCVFGVPSGKLLGFIISHRDIEANPEKISAITSMKAPTCIKDVQKLTGCMAALNRFISKLGERGLPFFKLLKHQEKFVWTPEVDQALAHKEVIDLFQDGLYHHRTFEDFGRRCPSSITHLKDMIISWADEEDKANAKYDAICGKSKQNTGGGSNNGNQGGRSNNYSGPNRKRKPDNTVAAIQRPAKDNSKKTSGGFKDLLKEKCQWHLDGNHTTEQCYQLRRALKDTPEPRHPHDKKGKKKTN